MTPLMLDEIIAAMGAKPVSGAADRLPVRVDGVSTDSRTVQEGDLFFAIRGDRFDGHSFVGDALEQAVAAVVERSHWEGGTPPPGKTILVVSDAIAALGALAQSYRGLLACPVIAVTGSNGKTSTKALIHHVLSGTRRGQAAQGSYNNHIGVPLTLLSAKMTDEYVVAELGTNAPGEIDHLAALASPTIAVITGVAEAHVERLRDVHGVAIEKASLLKHVRRGGLAVVHMDREALRHVVLGVEANGPSLAPGTSLLTYGEHEQADVRLTACRQDGEMLRFTVNGRLDLSLRAVGRHHAHNALAVFAVARRLGVSEDEIAERFASFTPPAMRFERKQVGTLQIIDDAYNANPGSMDAALQALRFCPTAGRRVLVLGDMRELGERSAYWHEWLGREAVGMSIDVLIAVGEHADDVVKAARAALKGNGHGRGRRPKLCAFPSAEAAAADVCTLVKSGDLVLVKGSRAVGLDRVVKALVESKGTTADSGSASRRARTSRPSASAPPVRRAAKRVKTSA